MSATPKFSGLAPSSKRASAAARGSSRKRDTRCEVELRRALWNLGARYRVAVSSLPGKPDVVFARQRVVVFCDGDFWHGRDLEQRLAKLERGHNSTYWVAKVCRNVERDREHEVALRAGGWRVVRLWETDILKDPHASALLVVRTLRE